MALSVNPSPRRGKAGLAQLIFGRMLAAAGPRHWWPCDPASQNCGKDEMIIGAVLTQNTAWKNVELALASLKKENLLDLEKLAVMAPESVAPLIRPAGYYNLKARRLSAVARFFAPAGHHRFAELAALPDEQLRADLLQVFGVGRETADSILLYALHRPSFVIDAYTLRIGRRHGIFSDETDYEAARAWFTRRAEPAVEHYNEYHALLVWIGNNFCKPTPHCDRCPLSERACFAHRGDWERLAPFR